MNIKEAAKQQKRILGLIRLTGITPASWQGRKQMQAMVYLLQNQKKGVDFGFRDFTLKVVGVHSTSLAKMLLATDWEVV
jgi:ATP phosphoribosyltransferase regulatory subunit HisZ